MELRVMRIEAISSKDLVIEQLKTGSVAEDFGELIERNSHVRNFTDRGPSVHLSSVVKRPLDALAAVRGRGACRTR
jgi:hypothetical protein